MAEEKSKKETEELLNQLKLVKEEVSQLKKKLSSISKEKEKLFSSKRQISEQIRDKISVVKGSKGERNEFTQEARKAKTERDKLNKLISQKIAEIKVMKKDYKNIAVKLGVKGNPAELKSQIDALEHRLETQPMAFDKEQKLMKEIKLLQKQYAQFKGVSEEWEKVSAKSKEIDELKKKANDYHKIVQDAAKLSQSQHENVLEDSKEIDDLKKSEEDVYQKFFEEKQKFKDVSLELKTKLDELQKIKEQLDGFNVALRAEAKVKEEKSLKEKTAEVEEKIEKRKKLTTEDLLVMQRSSK